ncbi:hypothetical protein ACTFIU_008547 [Dictyostelium citrinum]
MDENNQNTFCFTHSTQEITFICTNCDNSPVCNKCVVLKGIHFGHEIVEIDDDSVTPILKEMNEKTIPRLDELIKDNEDLLNNNTTKYKEIEEKHKSNLNIIGDEFMKLHTILQTAQNNLNQELITNLNENNDININFEMKVKEELKVLSKVMDLKNDYNFIDESANLNNKHVQIIKDAYQSNNILSSHFDQLPDYSDSTVTISDSSIDSIVELFNLIIKIKKEQHGNSTITSKKSLKYKWGKFIFTVYNDGDIISNDTCNLGIGEGQSLPKFIPKSVNRLLLPNGFNQSLHSLPKTVKSIYLFNIKFNLTEGSIPETVSAISFCDGFSQIITKGVIPKSVKGVYLYNIAKPPEISSIPSSVLYIGCSPSFKHPLSNYYHKIDDRWQYEVLYEENEFLKNFFSF